MSDKNYKNISSAIKISLNSFISVFLMGAVMLIGIFVIDKVNAIPQNNVEYWISKILNAIATFILMISVSNIMEEALKKRDKDYKERVISINNHYKNVMEQHETVSLEMYIEQINRANKYKAFINVYKRKLSRIKPKYRDKRKRIEDLLLMTPQEVWDSVHYIKYHKVTFSQLMTGEGEVSSSDDEYDLQVHKARHAIGKLCMKALLVVAFGGFTADFAYHFNTFDKTMIMPLIMKAITLLMAIYSGVSFGFSIADKRKQTLKKKLRIFSQFWQRVENPVGSNEERFIVEIPKDIVVEKIRNAR